MSALQAADVVVCDRLAPLGLLDTLDPGVEVIHVGKIPRGEFTPQERINAILVEQARAGRTVVRLKGGDSFVFGRGGEEWNACIEAGIPVSVIPGVTSSIAGPALAGIPVTHRELAQGFVVVSGHVGPQDTRGSVDWGAVARTGLTIVVLMGVANLEPLARALVANGLDPRTPAACVADAGLATQRVVRATVADLAAAVADADLRPPAVTVIGHAVAALAAPQP
jgi:uroporphyrin-III C-methyltransferase